MEQLIKSKSRVKKFAEVYTSEKIVNDMLNLLPNEVFINPLATFLEPACGNGNFLIEILNRKLTYIQGNEELYVLKCLSSLYGVDIQEDNIEEAKQRLLNFIQSKIPNTNQNFINHAQTILNNNIQTGNTLEPNDLMITQYIWNHDKCNTVKILFKDLN